MSKAISTVFVERVVDLGTLLVLFAVLALVVPVNASLRHAANSLVIVCGLGAVLIYGLLGFRTVIARILHRFAEKHPSRMVERAERIVLRFVDGMAPLGSASGIVLIVLCSFGSWLVEAAVYYLVAVSFGLNLSYPQTIFVMVCSALAVLVPSSPGYVGVFEWVVTRTVASFGVGAAAGMAFAIGSHVALSVAITLLGAFYALFMFRVRRSAIVATGEISNG